MGPQPERSEENHNSIAPRFFRAGTLLLPVHRSRPRACRQCTVEVFLLLGCIDGVCSFAAPRHEEGFLPYLERKALNLPMVGSAGSRASRADVIRSST